MTQKPAFILSIAFVLLSFVCAIVLDDHVSIGMVVLAETGVLIFAYRYCRGRLPELVTVLAALILGFLLGEVYFRLAYFGPRGLSLTRFKPSVTWNTPFDPEADPKTVTGYPTGSFCYKGACGSLNRQGFRHPENLGPKKAGIFRVVALGSSFTMGSGVADGFLWTERLEKLLNQDSRLKAFTQFEVINLGFPRLHPGNWLFLLREFVPSLGPDLVLVEDVPGTWSLSYWLPPRTMWTSVEDAVDRTILPAKRRHLTDGLWSFLLPEGHVLQNNIFLTGAIKTFASEEMPWAEGASGNGDAEAAPAYDLFSAVVERLRRFGHGVPVAYTMLRKPGMAVGLANAYREKIMTLCERARITCLDTYGGSFPPTSNIYPGDPHPNRFANEIYAREIFEQLSKRLIRRPAGSGPKVKFREEI